MSTELRQSYPCVRCGTPRVALPPGQLCGPCLMAVREVLDTAARNLEADEEVSPALCERCSVPLGDDPQDSYCGVCRLMVMEEGRVLDEYEEEEDDELTSRCCARCGCEIPEEQESQYCSLCAPIAAVYEAEEVAAVLDEEHENYEEEEDEEDAEDEEEEEPPLVMVRQPCSLCGRAFMGERGRGVCPLCLATSARGMQTGFASENTQPEHLFCSQCHRSVALVNLDGICNLCALHASPIIPNEQDDVQLFTMMRNVPDNYHAIWEEEGWDVFDNGGRLEIERDDAEEHFANDDEAIAHVIRLAAQGSKAHLLALWFHGQAAETSHENRTTIPRRFLPTGATRPFNFADIRIDV